VKPVHPDIIAYIRKMTESGITLGSQMMICVDRFVRQNFPEAVLPENFGRPNIFKSGFRPKAFEVV